MSYITATAVLAEYLIFPQATGTARFSETVALIGTMIPRAEAVINSYCCRRYAVPFTVVPPRIEEIAVNLTAYKCLISKFTKDSHNTNDWVEKVGEDAIKALEDIRDRKVDLVDTSGTLIVERGVSSRIMSSTENYQPFADVDDELLWKVPTNRLDAIDRTN